MALCLAGTSRISKSEKQLEGQEGSAKARRNSKSETKSKKKPQEREATPRARRKCKSEKAL